MRENIALALQARMGLGKFLTLTEQRQIAEKLVAALGVKTASIETPIGQLSGGNQQKAIIARWLATHPRVLILDEPTRGIDVAAKQELMQEILELARGGTAVLFISAEIEEVVRVSDRIMVLRDRAKAGELPPGADEDAVYSMIAQADPGHHVAPSAAHETNRPPRAVLAGESRWRCCSWRAACSTRRSSRWPGATVTCTAASSISSIAPRRSWWCHSA